MKRLIQGAALTAALLTTACAGTNTFMVQAEHTLTAGSNGWDAHTDTVIEDCRAQNLPSPEERAKCVEEVQRIDEKIVAPGVTAAVAAMQAYWLGVSVGEAPLDVAKHVADFMSAVGNLPVEYFGGLQGLKP